MSSEKSSEHSKSSKANPNLKSSIVHKPFATGTINIFNPYRKKGENKHNKETKDTKLSNSKLVLNAELEQDFERRKAELELSSIILKSKSRITEPKVRKIWIFEPKAYKSQVTEANQKTGRITEANQKNRSNQ